MSWKRWRWTGCGPGTARPSVTGRATRIAAAREALQQAGLLLSAKEKAAADAHRALQRASVRTAAARAAADAELTQESIKSLRDANAGRDKQREALAPSLAAAERDHNEVLGELNARTQKIDALTGQISRLGNDLKGKADEDDKLTTERDALDLAARHAAWGETAQAASQYLLSLSEHEQLRSTGDWNDEACHQLNEVVRLCFADDTPDEQMTAEIRELLVEQRWRRGGLDVRVRLAPALLRALHTHLTQTEQQDKYEKRQIEDQRSQRTKDLAAAQRLLEEAALASNVHRSSLATGIKAKMKRVAEEFDRLDAKYGGYGAGLDYPEPEPPSQPDKPWRWSVTPKWRRAEGQRMSSYQLRANTAQLDEKAVKLVCAAALTGSGNRPLLLVLDELGRNLGSEHRREAVALFEQIGQDRNITVVGALQDDMERYAVNASGLYIKLRRSSDTLAYNEAPVVNGSEENHSRVELLRSWLSAYRPDPGRQHPDAQAPDFDD